MEKFITRAARLNKAYDIELIERELVCGENDIIVKNHLCGVCGSDKSFYRGFMPPQTAEFRQPPEFPFLLGHESGGTVVAVGSRVSEYKVGDEVISGTTIMQITSRPRASSFSLLLKVWTETWQLLESLLPAPCTAA